MKPVVSKSTSTFMPGRQRLLDLGARGAHRLGDGDGVGAALLQDADRLHRRAVRARDAGDVLEAVLDERDVVEARRGAPLPCVITMSRSVCEIGASPSTRTSIALLAARRSAPPGDVTCCFWSALDDVGDGRCPSRSACRRRPRCARCDRGSRIIVTWPTPATVCSPPAPGSARRRRAAGARTGRRRRP